MKKLSIIVTLILVICCFTSCAEIEGGEYEVISVASYKIVTGANENGPIEETRLAFIYMNNGSPRMVANYHEIISNSSYMQYILVGDTNKYVVVYEHRKSLVFLYLTQETYDIIFTETK